MKRQQKFSAPVGYKLLNELSRNERSASSPFNFSWKPRHKIAADAPPEFNMGAGRRKSRKPVTLAKKA
jgi:hypothetical protein